MILAINLNECIFSDENRRNNDLLDESGSIAALNYSIESEIARDPDPKTKSSRKRFVWQDIQNFKTMTEANKFLTDKNFAQIDKKKIGRRFDEIHVSL